LVSIFRVRGTTSAAIATPATAATLSMKARFLCLFELTRSVLMALATFFASAVLDDDEELSEEPPLPPPLLLLLLDPPELPPASTDDGGGAFRFGSPSNNRVFSSSNNIKDSGTIPFSFNSVAVVVDDDWTIKHNRAKAMKTLCNVNIVAVRLGWKCCG